MTAEIYSGARPGRSRRLVLITAGLLVGVLGLAALQARERRNLLGPEQRIGDTPIYLRPPRGWQVDPQRPNRFVLPREQARYGSASRALEVHYERLEAFVSLEDVAARIMATQEQLKAHPARIGPWPAIEFDTERPGRFGRRAPHELVRFTCLPRGEVIHLVYQPLLAPGPADIAIFDEVCGSLRIADPTLSAKPDEYLARAGLTFPRDPEWTLVGADFEDVPGVFIGGTVNDVPVWAIGMYRTWLAAHRKPRDLLVDFAADRWKLWGIGNLIEEQNRADGATIASLRHPTPDGTTETAVWVIAKSPAEVTVMALRGPLPPQPTAVAAEQAAERIAAALVMHPIAAIPDMAAAEANGAALAADLLKAGAKARWGREPLTTRYLSDGRAGAIEATRAAQDRDPNEGYEGSFLDQRPRPMFEIHWRLRADGTYEWKEDRELPGGIGVAIREQRRDPHGPVTRRVQREQRWRPLEFRPGAGFVPPPLEPIPQAWVARGEPNVALVEVSTILGPATHTELLRQLKAEGGFPRVLELVDYWPSGVIVAFDELRADVESWTFPTAVLRRERQ